VVLLFAILSWIEGWASSKEGLHVVQSVRVVAEDVDVVEISENETFGPEG
jgi:hypothetical protein